MTTTTTPAPNLPPIDLTQLENLVTIVDTLLSQPAFAAIFPQAAVLHALNPVLKGALALAIQLQAQNGSANLPDLLQPILKGIAQVAALFHISIPTPKTA